MATGAHGLAGVTAQFLVAMDNKGEKENVMNQNVEERAVGAVNTVPSPATIYARKNVSLPLFNAQTCTLNIIINIDDYYPTDETEAPTTKGNYYDKHRW